MVLSARRGDAGILEFLEYRARMETIPRLVAQTVVALAIGLGALAILPFGQAVVLTFAFAYFCYGAWGLLDRAQFYSLAHNRRVSAKYLRLLCALFVGLGVLSGIGFLMVAGFMLLGDPWQL